MTPVRRWTAIVASAEAVGFAVAASVAVMVRMADLDATAAFALTVAGGAAEGALLGTGQWLAMGGHRPPAARWILATSAGAAFAWSLGLLPSTMGLAPSTPAAFVALGLGAVLLLASIPVAQWLMLRRPGTFRWVPVNMGAWAVAILWTFAPSPFIDERSPAGLVVVLYVVAGALMAVTIAALTARIATRYFAGGTNGTRRD